MCLVSQRKRERTAAVEAPGDFGGSEAIRPMAMGFNPVMHPTHAMTAQACALMLWVAWAIHFQWLRLPYIRIAPYRHA